MDPFQTGLFITIGAAIVGMFIRIEHRLTKVETIVEHIKEHTPGCPQTSEENTK